MTPERMAEWVARWVRFYTRKLPPSIAGRRIEEINADLHDHIADERAQGTNDRRIALSILSRLIRGIAADASWRATHAKPVAGKTAYRGVVSVALATGFLLLVPLVAMQFTDEVVWNLADFAAAGALLFGAGLAYQLVARKGGSVAYRAAVGVAVAAALLLLWVMGAVGVIGEEGDRADLMYFGVLAVGVVGAVIARYRPHGMALALLAMALAQAVVVVIALVAGKHQAAISSVFEILGVNGFFIALYIGSASLFRHADRRHP